MKDLAMKTIVFLAVAGAAAVALTLWAGAHGTEAEESVVVGAYRIEFSRPAYGVFAKSPAEFVFRLLDAESEAAVTFDSAHVQFKDASARIAAEAVIMRDQIGGARFRTALPEAGRYDVAVKFRKAEKEVVAAIFGLEAALALDTAKPTPLWKDYLWLGALAAGLLLGFAAGKQGIGF